MPRGGAVSCSPLFEEYLNTLMPSYFPEGDEPLPSDSFERLLQKAVSVVSEKNEGVDAPAPTDSKETLMFKLVRGLRTALDA
jgi:hypothetical protein